MKYNLKNDCELDGTKPAIVNVPYPPIEVQGKNKYYADLISQDYCSAISELTAITQYVNHETRFSGEYCDIAAVLLSIAMAEMSHLQMLGQLIILLGGTLSYDATTGRNEVPWKVDYVDYGCNGKEMIMSDIKGEKQAIAQYNEHISMINDPCVTAVLERIVLDEKYHVALLSDLLISLC